MNDFEKVSRLEMALRIVSMETRKSGGPDNVRASEALNEFLKRASMGTKLRMADLIIGDSKQPLDDSIIPLRQPK